MTRPRRERPFPSEPPKRILLVIGVVIVLAIVLRVWIGATWFQEPAFEEPSDTTMTREG